MSNQALKIEAAKKKAMALRFKKPLVREINLEDIQRALADMDEACGNVKWYFGQEVDELDELLGEDDAYEFKASFSALSADIERVQSEMDDIWLPDWFDDFLAACNPNGTEMMGYDSYEEDYFSLGSYETEAACRCAKDRIIRKTKNEIIDAAHIVIGVIVQYMSIKYRFDSLSASFDVLMDRTESQLRAVKEIEEAYEAANADKFYDWADSTRKLNRLLRELPDQYWIE